MGPLELSLLVAQEADLTTGRSKRLRGAIRRAVADGKLALGEKLPSTRAAADSLAMSRNGVQDAYESLVAEGVIETSRGRAPTVLGAISGPEPNAASQPISISSRGHDLADNPVGDVISSVAALSPGLPDPDLFPHEQWARILRRAGRRRYREAENYADYQGLPALRTALANHILRMRGVRVPPDRILITSGTQAGARLVTSLTTDPEDVALVEDPGYGGARAVLQSMRLQVIPMTEPRLPAAQLAYVTPSTQYPAGERMPLPQRLSLLAWAAKENAVILEDDYDSDFVWRHRDVPPLFALDQNQRVFMLGTVSKSLLPSLRLGWVVLPEGVQDIAVRAHRTLGLAANLHVQAALADFLEEGLYARHVRRTGDIYRGRKDMLVSSLKKALGDRIKVSDPEGGLQLMVTFRQEVDDIALVENLQAGGFQPKALSSLCLGKRKTGLVAGFAGATETRALKFCNLLGALTKQEDQLRNR